MRQVLVRHGGPVVAFLGALVLAFGSITDREAFASVEYEPLAAEVEAAPTADDLAEQTAAQSDQLDTALEELRDLVGQKAEDRAALVERNQWVIPVTGYRISGRFGVRNGLWTGGHGGLDLAAPHGSTIVAMASGTVTFTGNRGACGLMTTYRLDDGVTEIKYCHQSQIAVRPGERVAPGQVMGFLGSTGRSTGPHLHIEVRVGGAAVDPEQAMAEHSLYP